MRILFIGTVDFSYAALSLLLENKYDVVGLVTKRKSGFNSDFSDLQPLAEKYGVPVVFREQNNDDEIETFIESKHPDVIYCLGWSHLLPSRILRIPRYGVVGFHPAALPDNKGRHPIIWALFLGLKNTASTFFFMDEGADSGDIILQENIVIDEDDTAATLYEKIQKKGLEQLMVLTEELEVNKGRIPARKQDSDSGNTWRKRGKCDGRIDFRMSTRAILNLVRALTHPYVGAHIDFMESEIKVWKAVREECDSINIEPGKILYVENGEIVVKTYDGAIRILEHEFDIMPKKGEYL